MKLKVKYIAAICVDEKGREYQINLDDQSLEIREEIIAGNIKTILTGDKNILKTEKE